MAQNYGYHTLFYTASLTSINHKQTQTLSFFFKGVGNKRLLHSYLKKLPGNKASVFRILQWLSAIVRISRLTKTKTDKNRKKEKRFHILLSLKKFLDGQALNMQA